VGKGAFDLRRIYSVISADSGRKSKAPLPTDLS